MQTAGRVTQAAGFVNRGAAFVTEAAASGDRRGGGEGVAGQAAELWWNRHGIPPRTEKAARGAAFFVSYPLLLEYQVGVKPAKILCGYCGGSRVGSGRKLSYRMEKA